jgi:PAS domain S-box-containing protein
MTSQPTNFDARREPEMVARFQTTDWSKTPLGARRTWSASLKLVVDVMLASGFPMCVRWGPELVMIYNDGYRSILGAKHPHAFGLPFHEAWPEVQTQLLPVLQPILNGTSGAYFAEDLLIKVQRRGSLEWEDARFTVSYSPVPDDTVPNGVGGVLVTAVETTKRFQSEQDLRASEERFARIFEQTAVGIIQCELDGRFLLVNKRFCEITGRTSEELLTLRVPDITHPDHWEKDANLRRRLVADGVPFSVEKRYLRPDGSEVWVSIDVSLMRSADGTRQQLIGVAQDISKSKTTEANLRKTTALFEAVIKMTPDLVYVKDLESRALLRNPAALLGKNWDEIEGRKEVEWHKNSQEAEAVVANDRQVIATGVSMQFVEPFTTPQGPRTLLSTKSPLFDESGKIVGVIGVSTDITEREDRAKQLEFVMHELTHRSKNLLTIIQSVARQSIRQSSNLKDFESKFVDRLSSLASLHDLLVQKEWQGASLRAIAETQVGPFGFGRFEVDGPEILLKPNMAQIIAMAFHELATNAAKYGALSNNSGTVLIKWGLQQKTIFIKWQEAGGPVVATPERTGFGSIVLQRTALQIPNASASLQFLPSGVVWDLKAPLEWLVDTQQRTRSSRANGD